VETKRWHTREDSGIRLDAEGRFWHDGEPIENPNVGRAFHRGLVRAPDGRFMVRFGWDFAYVQVDDAPYQVLGISLTPDRITLRLDDETEEPLDPAEVTVSDQGVLYARIKDGGCEARFSRAAQGQIAPLLNEREGMMELELDGRAHRVGIRRLLPVPPPNPNPG
jgi:uncharacterized protein